MQTAAAPGGGDAHHTLTFRESGNPLPQQLHTNTRRISARRQHCSRAETERPFLEAAHRDRHEMGLPGDVAVLMALFHVSRQQLQVFQRSITEQYQ